ncbi:hypothetical protein [Actinomadura sp. WMMB 499]|uniref:hypothetical protein n=1 Tax=Actinomadura sp. WMMB 499 TaxID=1219491 RepID=UPI0020C771EA|nr:hypothetical protein [Actinomadura sp. WMMB 499]
MDIAARLHRVLTEPAPEDEGFVATDDVLAALPGTALGDLLPAAYAVPDAARGHAATIARFAVEEAAAERQPEFTPDACRRMFDALVAGLPRRNWADLTLGTAALARCPGPWPDGLATPARTLVRFLLDAEDLGAPLALLAVAGLTAAPPQESRSGDAAGETAGRPAPDAARARRGSGGGAAAEEADQVAREAAAARGPGGTERAAGSPSPGEADGDLLAEVAGRLSRGAGPVAAGEIGVIAGLGARDRVWLTELDRGRTYTAPPPLPDAWHRAAGIDAYAAWARSALREAAERARAVQDGTVPYKADKAFGPDEVVALGRAARVALAADEPWLPALFDRLLPDIAVAPTGAKTLPSQALLFEIVRAAQDVPTPELVTAIRNVRGAVRHAGCRGSWTGCSRRSTRRWPSAPRWPSGSPTSGSGRTVRCAASWAATPP